MDIIISIITLFNGDWHFLNKWMWSLVVLGGEFILLLFIGVMADGWWSELRDGCFGFYNVLVIY